MRRATTPPKMAAPVKVAQKAVAPAKVAPKMITAKSAEPVKLAPKGAAPAKTVVPAKGTVPAKAAPTKTDPPKAAQKKLTPVTASPVKSPPRKAAPKKAALIEDASIKPALAKAASKKKTNALELFVCRSGPRRGNAHLEAAFRTKPEAVAFLANVHGLASDEQKALAREGKLALNPRVHGSELCAIKAVKMPPPDAAKALSGEMYL